MIKEAQEILKRAFDEVAQDDTEATTGPTLDGESPSTLEAEKDSQEGQEEKEAPDKKGTKATIKQLKKKGKTIAKAAAQLVALNSMAAGGTPPAQENVSRPSTEEDAAKEDIKKKKERLKKRLASSRGQRTDEYKDDKSSDTADGDDAEGEE